jgi:hypothetical protein
MSTPVPGATSTIIQPEDLTFAPFSLPGFNGSTEAAFPNTDVSRAPFIALLRMVPGATLAKHYHPAAIECVYVLNGTMINDGQLLQEGTYVLHGPGVVHGPHTTETGCTLMFIQYPGVGPDDSVFVD